MNSLSNVTGSFCVLMEFSLSLAVNAAVNAVFGVGELESLRQLLLYGSNAAGILAGNNTVELRRQFKLALFDYFAVLNQIYSDAGIKVTEDIKVEVDKGINLNNILLAGFAALCILYDCNSAVKIIEVKELIQLHTGAGLNMVNYIAVSDRIYIHYSTSKSIMIRAMRMYLP